MVLLQIACAAKETRKMYKTEEGPTAERGEKLGDMHAGRREGREEIGMKNNVHFLDFSQMSVWERGSAALGRDTAVDRGRNIHRSVHNLRVVGFFVLRSFIA